MNEQEKIDGKYLRDKLAKEYEPLLSYDESADYDEWKKAVREKYISLLGLDLIARNACPLNVEIEKVEKKDGYTQTRFLFESEHGSVVPCYLLVPDTGKKKYPVAIVLQGHSTGAHISIGEKKYLPRDESSMPRGAHALQAIEQGYAALAIEQRGMGERAAINTPDRRVSIMREEDRCCYYEAMTGILLGRTLLGERVWDISRAVDALQTFDNLDISRLIITGGSGGGTASYYAACYDERIKICAPVVSFCPYRESILRFYHCSCNYIPSAYRYFDMQDLSCLIAPRKLVIVNGKLDPSFLIEGARRGYETVKKVYAREKSPDNCRFIETEMGHYWCNDIIWNAIGEEFAKLK